MQNTFFVYTFLLAKANRMMTSGGGKGQRISGVTAGSWFLKQAISFKKCWGGYRSKTQTFQTKSATSTVACVTDSPALSLTPRNAAYQYLLPGHVSSVLHIGHFQLCALLRIVRF